MILVTPGTYVWHCSEWNAATKPRWKARCIFRFMIKVITDAEHVVLMRHLLSMVEYLRAHPASYLTRIVGIYAFKKSLPCCDYLVGLLSLCWSNQLWPTQDLACLDGHMR